MIRSDNDKEFERFRKKLWLAGIVIEIERFKIIGDEKNSFSLHKKAALSFMKIQQEKAAENAKKYATKEIPEDKCWNVKIYTENPGGKKITWSEFLGDKELNCCAHGFYSAFMDPPYGIFEKEKKDLMYDKLIKLIKPSDFHPVEIYTWDTDWSNYFDAGKEWWGAYLWTVLTEYGESVTVIGASATD